MDYVTQMNKRQESVGLPKDFGTKRELDLALRFVSAQPMYALDGIFNDAEDVRAAADEKDSLRDGRGATNSLGCSLSGLVALA